MDRDATLTMTSRERVLTALDHREPDRVPIEFGSPATLSMIDGAPYGYGALLDLLGITDAAPPVLARAFSNSVTNIDPRILAHFGADLRWVGAGGPDVEEQADGTLHDPWWGFDLVPLGAINQADDAAAPLRHATTWDEIAAHPSWPDPADPRVTAGAAAAARAHREAGYAVVANPAVGCLVFHHYQRLRGFDTWLYDMVDDPALYHRLCERILDIDLAIMERFLPEVAPFIDMVFMADDLGSQEGMLVSPDAYRTFLKPYQAAWIAAARRLAPGARIAYHSCGSFREVLPDLIEIGVEVLTPVQPLARGMESTGPEGRLRTGPVVHGWAGHPAAAAARHARAGARRRPRPGRCAGPRRRLHLRGVPRAAARRAAGEHRGDVRGGPGGRAVSAPGLTAGLPVGSKPLTE